ncbi:Ger(x)C family spore germination protein [Paenibacillus sp. PR3]|uniref:Ger(X)C family spore germination protein n=1 Tax=Paenibacillus terricola TaxID=2763503 RepID=A0ABR8N2E4_9BACL|nr:Ger(x)C family spore germination protein [Paenibacillus terricola]MBD3921456.1 Ger(x)C family spore germination protein [Paenibacillus terricola]
MSFGWLRNAIKALLGLSVALVIGGCWDEVDLQDVGYVTALGVDYKDGKYILYGEMIGFSAVAKTEGGTPDKSPVIWIGRGEGDTVFEAIRSLIKSSQYQVSIEQLKSIVIQERAMLQINELLDALNRQRASRYTVWMFGTRDEIEKLFTTHNLFNRSPLISLLYAPHLLHEQISAYRSMNMQMYVQQLNEPSITVLLPSLTAETGDWKQMDKPMKLNLLDGVFLFSNRSFIGYMSDNDYRGIRWLQPDFKHELLAIKSDGDKATISVDDVKQQLKAIAQGDHVRFKLKITIKAHLVEMGGKLSKQELESVANKIVTKELQRAYKSGLKQHADVFQTRLNLYRYHLSYWKKHVSGHDWLPGGEDMDIEVRTILQSSGKYELQ